MTLRSFIPSGQTSLRLLIAVLLISFVIWGRLVPHPANFAPVAAVAIFGGAVLPRAWALALPLAAIVASDLVIGLHPLVVYTWGSFVLIALASSVLLRSWRPKGLLVASIGSSLTFYLVTNFGVWLEGRLYQMDFAGLVACYYNALPFLRGTIAGDLLYTALLFGVYSFAVKLADGRSLAKPQTSQIR